VVVIGAGPIGLLVAQCARLAGAGTLMVVEPSAERRAIAGQLGAEVLIDPNQEDTADRIRQVSGRDGADVVFECAGIPATVDTAVALCRRGGAASLVGVPEGASTIQTAAWLVKEIRLNASLGYQREEFDLTQALVLDGRLKLPPLHTSTVDLEGLPKAFETLARDPDEIKILVKPTA